MADQPQNASLNNLSPAARPCYDQAKETAWQLKSTTLNTTHLLIGCLRGAPDTFASLLQSGHSGDQQFASTTILADAMRAAVAASIRLALSDSERAINLVSDVRDFVAEAASTDPTPPERPKLKPTAKLRAAMVAANQLASSGLIEPVHLLLAALANQEDDSLLRNHGYDAPTWTQVLEAQATARSQSVQSDPREAEQLRLNQQPTPYFEKYTRDLTQMARDGKLGPVVGREREIRAVIEVLCKLNKNNPALIGEPGVGKTAIAEGLAIQVSSNDVPPQLRHRRVVALDMSSLIAGATYRGEFEDRLRGVINEARSSHAILFIDELHTLIGAGSAEGALDAANILKPPLARGEIACVGATTAHEYRKYIERDGALERRFQPLTVSEPTPEATISILQAMRPRLEAHHNLSITDNDIRTAVDLGRVYLRNRFFPDKAIDILQTAAARAEIAAYEQTKAPSNKGAVRLADYLRSVVSEMANLPLENFDDEQLAKYADMERFLDARVVGQEEVVARVSNAIRLCKRRLDINPMRPDGVFLFMGPPGVGKTELVKSLAEFLFADRERIIRLDMSEFSAEFSITRLIGAPPGYVGYDEGGQLTEKIRRQPFSIILLDEIEKAHPQVQSAFLQIFDDGRLTDGQGRTVYFSDATIIMTSNVGSDLSTKGRFGFKPTAGKIASGHEEVMEVQIKDVYAEARKYFSLELLNRVDEILLFKPLNREGALVITRQKLDLLRDQRFKPEGLAVEFAPGVAELIVARGFSAQQGARQLEHTIDELILGPMARAMFRKDWNNSKQIKVGIQNDEITIAPLAV